MKTIKNAFRGFKIVFRTTWNGGKMIVLQRVLRGAFSFGKDFKEFHFPPPGSRARCLVFGFKSFV